MTVSTLTVLILSLFLAGCQLPYLMSGAVEQVKILSSRQKIEKTIESVATDEETKVKLSYALKAKDYAADNGLNCKKNFGTFVQLDRPYVSYLVVASPKDKIEAKMWSFPIVGSFPYKGFFSEKQADREITKLRKKDFDTYMRGVTAYSSLGWFKEPILSSMLRYSKESLAETIFHECFHGTFFVKDNVEKNEQLAVFVGHYYLLKFLKDIGDAKKYEKEVLSWQDQKLFTSFLEKTLEDAKSFYSQKNAQREKLFEKIRASYKAELKPKLKINNYDSIFLKDLNNAKIVAFKTYFHKFDGLEHFLNESHDGDVTKMVAQLSKLKTQKDQLKFLKNQKLMGEK
jgi:predicted aminopeptidase